MTHKLEPLGDNIIRTTFIGDIDNEAFDAFMKDIQPFLEQASPEKPLKSFMDASREGKYSARARQELARLGRDPRIGSVAVINSQPFTRVMGVFMMKVTGRDDIRFFDDEESALAWLREQ